MTNKKDNAASEHDKNIHAEVVPRQGISIIWFVPFIALIFGLWLT